MQVRSKILGEIESTKDKEIYLPDGILGFEDLKRYVITEDERYLPFLWMVSTEDPEVAFAIADPAFVYGEDYEAGLSDADRDILDLQSDDPIALFVLVSMSEGDHRFTANLKGPVVMNTRNRVAKQVVVYNPAYSFRQPISLGDEGQDATDRTSRLRAQVYR